LHDDDAWKLLNKSLVTKETDTAAMVDCDILIPPYGSKASSNLIDAANGSKPILVWGGASEYLFEKGGTVGAKVFGTFTPAKKYMDTGLDALKTFGAATVAFVQNDNPFSRAVCAGAMEKAEVLGLTARRVIEYGRYSNMTTMKSQLALLLESDYSADVIVNCGHEEDTVAVIKSLRDLGVCPKAILATNSLVDLAGNYQGLDSDLKNHIMMPSQWSRQGKYPDAPISTAAFVSGYAKFANVMDTDVTYHVASAFLAGLAITKAMEDTAGATFVEADFLKSMRALDYDTCVGRVKFSAAGSSSGLVGANELKPMVTEQFQTGSTEIVAPNASQTKPPLYDRACYTITAPAPAPPPKVPTLATKVVLVLTMVDANTVANIVAATASSSGVTNASTVAITSVTITTSIPIDFGTADISLADCRAVVAATFSVPLSTVACAAAAPRRLVATARRLPSSVTASIEQASGADAAKLYAVADPAAGLQQALYDITSNNVTMQPVSLSSEVVVETSVPVAEGTDLSVPVMNQESLEAALSVSFASAGFSNSSLVATSIPDTSAPTVAPTTDAPTAGPTEAPTTSAPTDEPTVAGASNEAPTGAPTEAPTTAAPTVHPTEAPNDGNTTAPTSAPTNSTEPTAPSLEESSAQRLAMQTLPLLVAVMSYCRV
jgi:hypothetical protein